MDYGGAIFWEHREQFQNLWGHVTLATPTFTLFSHSGVGGLQDMLFELCAAIIGP